MDRARQCESTLWCGNRWNKNNSLQLSPQNATNHGGHMPNEERNFIDQQLQDLNDDGVDRRGFLKCMAWAGTGLVWTMSGGIPVSQAFAKSIGKYGKSSDLTFVQISDSHMGFNKPANTDVIGTLKTAIDQINGLAVQPEFLLHTGDISHLSK